MAQYMTNQEVHRKTSQISLPALDCIKYQNNHLPKLKYFKSPRVHNLLILDEVSCEPIPHPDCSLLTPFLKIFHWVLLVPYVIEYDGERGRFFCKKKKLLGKGLSYIWLLLMCIYLSLICFNDVAEKYTVKAVVGKFTWACYTLFDVTVIICLRQNGDKIAKILTEGNRISYLCERIDGRNVERFPPKNDRGNCLKYTILVTCLVAVIYTIAFVLYVIPVYTATTTRLVDMYMSFTSVDGNSKQLESKSGQEIRDQLLKRYTSSASASILLTAWVLMAFGVEIIWVVFLTMTASLGYYFKRLLRSSIDIIKHNHVETCEGIRIFAKITLLLEDLNKLFGTTMLWIVIASVMYTAVTLADFLAGFTNEFVFDFLNLLGLLPFITTLYTGSELNRTGHILPSLLKRQYLYLDITDQNQLLQVVQGTNVVQFDALSNNIGLKGHGFFTISYIFVTSLVGVIITYSLVAVQFKLGEIPISSS